jgi:predicted lipid-binding transport protein (Tim44 family)
MQTAYDFKNLNDIREFTTPEVYAEIQLQIQERGDAQNATHVISIDAEFLGVESEQQADVASVRFTGLIQEERNQAAEPINEIWHFKNTGANDKWLIAGVQQN